MVKADRTIFFLFILLLRSNMTSSIQLLANELLYEICDNLTGSDKKTFRAVCRLFNSLAEPSLLSTVTVDVSKHEPHASIAQLDALATNSTRAVAFARSLKVRSLAPSYADEQSENDLTACTEFEARMKRHLKGAIVALQNVHNVGWTANRDDPEWAIHIVFDALTRLSSLENLTLSFLDSPISGSLQLDRFSGLRKLNVSAHLCGNPFMTKQLANVIGNSPQLSRLSVHCNQAVDEIRVTLGQLLAETSRLDEPLKLKELELTDISTRMEKHHFRHLRSLTSLKFSGLQNNQSDFHVTEVEDVDGAVFVGHQFFGRKVASMWDLFRTECIYLTKLSVDVVHDELLDYLSTYSGLEELNFASFYNETQDSSSNALADKFYTQVLPKHVETIKTLSIEPLFESRWCFGEHNTDIISQCKKLTHLGIPIDHTTLDGEKSNALTSLLSICAQFPRCDLSLFAVNGPISNGYTMMLHRQRVVSLLCGIVSKFGPVNPLVHPSTIKIRTQKYVIEQGEELGVWKYVR